MLILVVCQLSPNCRNMDTHNLMSSIQFWYTLIFHIDKMFNMHQINGRHSNIYSIDHLWPQYQDLYLQEAPLTNTD